MNFLQNIDSLEFKQWEQTDRCHLNSMRMDAEEFVETFLEKLSELSPHNIIAEQQVNYLKQLKTNLEATDCIIIADFSENYSFVILDAIQGFHWANAQCTIHPFAIYYKDEAQNLKFTSFIAIAEFTKHNHVAVRLFVTNCVNFIKKKLPHLKNIHFFLMKAVNTEIR